MLRRTLRSPLVLALGLASWLLTGSTAYAAKSTLTVTFDTRSMASALWYPDKLDVIRGVLVFTGGQGPNDQSGDTRPYANNRFYQRFAESIGFAILGNQFTGSYTEAGGGPGQALLDTLAQYATKLNHPELAHAPLLLEGFSNGGYFSITFAKFKPERVIAFALNKSGFTKVQMDPAFAAVPGVLFWGEEELTKGLPTVIHSIIVQGRKEHALWAELKEWGRGHEEGDVERMFVPFFADMVAARYPAGKNPLKGDVALYPLDESSGWLGDHSDASIETNLPVIAPFEKYTGDKAAASWLPSEGLANLWRGFVTKTPISMDMPVSQAQLSATQLLQLNAAGLAAGDAVTFYDGATPIAKDVPVNATGAARGQWMPGWGGGRGILAVVSEGGLATRTSRPSVVALYGKAPPPGPSRPESSAAPAGAGPGGAMMANPTVGLGTSRPGLGEAGSAAVLDAAVTDASEVERDASFAGDASAAEGGEADASDQAEASSGRGRSRRHGTFAGGSCAVTPIGSGDGIPMSSLSGAFVLAVAWRLRRRVR